MERHALHSEFKSSYGTVRYGIRGNGTSIVLVHGTPWSSFNWRHLIRELSREYKVHYYDLLGYGQSEQAEDADVSLGIQNKVLSELFDHWNLENPILIGHDFGGTTVLRTLLLNRRTASHAILIDPVAIGPWGSPFFAYVKQHESVFAGLPGYIHEAIVSAYVQNAQYLQMDKETLHGILRPWLGDSGQHAFYRQIAQADHLYTQEIESRYGEIEIPVLLIWGEQDEWIPIEKGFALGEKMDDVTFVTIPEAGHLVQEDAPDILVREINRFLKSQEI
ncbi:alpha/beta hydrolase [Saccharibacillus sacchari]|uniref:Alpha/beta hydrolase n=1 Tax=Saccharibacillus sacchari TaxID=456493 RepID=A0ACC6PH27_9BACL